MVTHAANHKKSNQDEAPKPNQGPVEVARLHKPLDKEFLRAEVERMRAFGRPEAVEVAVARERDKSDRNTLDEARARGRIKADSIMGLIDNRNNDQEKPAIIGFELQLKLGGRQGTQFNAGITGALGDTVSSAISAAGAVTNGTKAGEFFNKIDANKRINQAIAEKTGWQHDPNIDTRSQSEIALSDTLSRAAKHDKWSAAARKENFPGFDKADSQAVNATRYVVSLLEPSFTAFKNKHPRISETDFKSIRSAVIDHVLAEKPYPDDALMSGLKKLVRSPASSGIPENSKLSAESKSWVEGLIKDQYSGILENRKGKK